jgi:hypothetical protein
VILYERLIEGGIMAVGGHGSTIDHLTARRLAIWLAARPQEQISPEPGPLRPRPA